MLPVFSTTTLPSLNRCKIFFKEIALLTRSSLFFFRGITAAFIGARCGLKDKSILSLPSSIYSTLKASFNTANTPRSTPADGSMTYGTISFLFSKS